MQTYIFLVNITDQGIKGIKDFEKRVAGAKAAFKKAGGKWISYHLTLGQYDGVAVGEFPTPEAAFSVLLAISKLGNIRTTTLTAFPEKEVAKIIKKIS
ncbi:MAG: GYD domain-containing protein [Nitrososphaerales archaeon]